MDEKFSTLNVDIVAYLCNIVSPVFGAEDSGMMVDSVFASLKMVLFIVGDRSIRLIFEILLVPLIAYIRRTRWIEI